MSWHRHRIYSIESPEQVNTVYSLRHHDVTVALVHVVALPDGSETCFVTGRFPPEHPNRNWLLHRYRLRRPDGVDEPMTWATREDAENFARTLPEIGSRLAGRSTSGRMQFCLSVSNLVDLIFRPPPPAEYRATVRSTTP